MANLEFISRLHEGFNFPLRKLRAYIEKNVGITVADFRKVTAGYDSEVYDIGEFFVKIRREGEVPHGCIKWAVEQCAGRGIKVPKIFHCGTIDELDIIVEGKVAGEPLPPSLYEEAGVQLRKIHSVRVGGFWRRHLDGNFDFAEYADLAASNTRERMKEIPLINADGVFDTAAMQRMEEALREYEGLKSTAVLCHGDYAPRHILCEGGEISGIIDFGEFHGGSGYSDLAYFALNSDERYFEDFLAGYGDINECELQINKIISLMGYLAHSRKIGDESDAKRLEIKLERNLLRAF